MAFVNFYLIVVLTFVTLQPDPVGREQCVVGGSSDYGSKEKDYSDLSDKSDRLAVAACVPAASPLQIYYLLYLVFFLSFCFLFPN